MKGICILLITTILLAGMVGCGGNGVRYDLTVSSTTGGNVTTPGEGTFSYGTGVVVNLVATPDVGCRFINWTGDMGTIDDTNDATTTITMNGDYSVTANFAAVYDLTITSTSGGSVSAPGEGTFSHEW